MKCSDALGEETLSGIFSQEKRIHSIGIVIPSNAKGSAPLGKERPSFHYQPRPASVAGKWSRIGSRI